MKYMRGPAKERFARLYIPEPNSGCWLWEGSSNSDGYGRFLFRKKRALAHRASYEMHCEPIPEGMQVLHHCDVPACVNPDHLFLGTVTDNMRDMVAKGRGKTLKGADHPKAKLNPEKASEIRRLSAGGMSRNEVARQFGVTKPLVKMIVQNRIWRSEALS